MKSATPTLFRNRNSPSPTGVVTRFALVMPATQFKFDVPGR